MKSPALLRGPRRAGAGGFTLAEVAVTLMIVGIGLVLVLQGLNTARATAYQTHNRKVARELALLTLAQIEAGLFWEEIDDRLFGTYGEEGYEEWSWEVVLGEETFTEEDYDEESGVLYDTYRERELREDEEREDRDEEEDEEAREPFEKVRIRVSFPRLGEFPNFVTLERWIPWDQVYGPSEEDLGASPEEPAG